VTISGVERLRRAVGPLFAVIGVFDGLHRGHQYLLARSMACSGDEDDDVPQILVAVFRMMGEMLQRYGITQP
jgi:FAD synthase